MDEDNEKAIIYWISEEEGGRKRPPIGTEYYPTIQMENGDTWSLAIRFDRTNVEQNEMKDNCEVGFLFDNAPYHLLKAVQNLLFMRDHIKSV